MSKYKSYIIEGVDRLGKSTLIQNLEHTYGFFNVIHYEKPKLLNINVNSPQGKTKALEFYQRDSFHSMFELLNTREHFIMDRGHLGEMVYAPRYRGYSGDYVFSFENDFIYEWKHQDPRGDFAMDLPPVKLILLVTSDFSFIKDDGLSFDFAKKEEEQLDFINAFNRSKLQKVMIDVSNGNGGFKDALQILSEATA